MPGASAITWNFPTDKLWFVVNSFLPMLEDPMMLILGLTIIFGIGTVVVLGLGSVKEMDPARLDTGQFRASYDFDPQDVRVPPMTASTPWSAQILGYFGHRDAGSYPAWSPSSAPAPSSKRVSGRVIGDNAHRSNPFNTSFNTKLNSLNKIETVSHWVEVAFWVTFSQLNPLRLLNFLGFEFKPFSRDGWFGGLFYPHNWIRMKDYDDPFKYLKAIGVFNPSSFVNGQYVDPQSIYNTALAELPDDLRAKFLEVKPILSGYYKNKLNDYQLLEIFSSQIRGLNRDQNVPPDPPDDPETEEGSE